MQKLWINYETGDVTCVMHAGAELTAGINANGKQKQTTSFGTYQLDAVDVPCLECYSEELKAGGVFKGGCSIITLAQ